MESSTLLLLIIFSSVAPDGYSISISSDVEILVRQKEANPVNYAKNKPTPSKQRFNEDLNKHGIIPRKKGETFTNQKTWCFWIGTCTSAHYYKHCCKIFQPYCPKINCKRKRNSCPLGWASVGSGCYDIVNAETFKQAKESCEAAGGFLVEITSQVEQDVLRTFYEDSPFSGWVWLGANKNKEDEWRWIYSGNKITFNLWKTGQPNNAKGNENCLIWDGNISWKDISCEERNTNLKAICEKSRECLPTTSTTLSTTNSNSDTLKPCHCGRPNQNQNQHQGLRIWGGQTTEKNEYPWQVALVYGYENIPFCGGSLISRETVLTAAHCTEGLCAEDISVLIGEHNVTNDNDGQTKMKIKQIIQNDLYNFSSIDYDFSLLILESPVCNKKAMPIRLPNQSTKNENVKATISGWGKHEDGGQDSDILREANVWTMTNTECTTNKNYKTTEITPRMICASGSGMDACFGDSGGPLVTEEEDGYFSIIGVVSWGKDCAQADSTGIYSRVFNQISWIKDNMVGQTCVKPDADLEAIVRAQEKRERAQEESIQSLAAKLSKLETCLGDVNSMDCPSSDNGKISVVDTIKRNKELIEAVPKFNLALIAGYNSGRRLATSEIMSPGGVCSQSIPPLPVAVNGAQSVYFSNTLMVCGGYGGGYRKKCQQLHGSNSEWTEGPTMNRRRHLFSMTKVGQDLYALGGDEARTLDSMEKLSESSGKWTMMAQKLTSPRRSHCTVFMETTRSLVTIGGVPITNLVEEFGLATSTWKELAPLPVAVYGHGCVMIGHSIVVTGGWSSSSNIVQKKVFTFAGGQWATTGELEQAKYYHSMATLDNKVLVLGGGYSWRRLRGHHRGNATRWKFPGNGVETQGEKRILRSNSSSSRNVSMLIIIFKILIITKIS